MRWNGGNGRRTPIEIASALGHTPCVMRIGSSPVSITLITNGRAGAMKFDDDKPKSKSNYIFIKYGCAAWQAGKTAKFFCTQHK
jgi:hypothetical protein